MTAERELELRRERFRHLRAAMREVGAADLPLPDRSDWIRRMRDALGQFRAAHDVEQLRADLNSIGAESGFTEAFPGFNFGVRLFYNQLADVAQGDGALGDVLAAAIELPNDDSEGEQRLTSLVEFTERIRQGGQPAPKSAAIFLSFVWWLQHPSLWPFLWPKSEEELRRLGWLRSDRAPVDHYLDYRDIVRTVHDNDAVVEATLAWADEQQWLGLDLRLSKRLAWASELNGSWNGSGYPEGMLAVARTNMDAVLAEMRLLGDLLLGDLSDTVGRTLRRFISPEFATGGVERVRDDAWVKWRLKSSEGWNEAPSVQVVVRPDAVLVGFLPGRRERGWAAAMRPVLEPLVPEDLEFIPLWTDPAVTLTTAGEYLIGRRFSPDEALGTTEFADQVVSVAASIQPLMDKALSSIEIAPAAQPERSDLRELHDKFLATRGYPIEKDDVAHAKRAEFAELLRCDRLDELTPEDFRLIFNTHFYGSPGPQSGLNKTLNQGDPERHDEVIAALRELLCGDAPLPDRINRCLDINDLGMKGLGESVLMKLLAIAEPERILPVFPVTGDNGKAALLKALGVPVPSTTMDRGQRQVVANDDLVALLEPYFPGDPWGMAQFAYWIRDQQVAPVDDPLDAVVDDCYLPDRSFVDELIELLEDKRQIVLYGPPGTGKTFLARKLQQALAPADQQRRFVQFHPSTSYEDFFEGYRPDTDASGNLSYRLTPGPFAQLADHAAEDTRRHVLVIDELNRANIPKVFGELLFLLEYRDQTVSPLYREEFSLPENLWVIATMNTADRSIASLDAALRRRFHFVPIFPDTGPMEGLLDRYLQRNAGDRQWARLVDMVNGELRERLGSGDQLIGPSHFLKPNLDEAQIARIWRYNVEPLMDDLFYGDRATISEFHWPEVIDRFRKSPAFQDVLPNSVVVADPSESGPVAGGPAAVSEADDDPGDVV